MARLIPSIGNVFNIRVFFTVAILLNTFNFHTLAYSFSELQGEVNKYDTKFYNNFEIVDKDGKYVLEWVANWSEQRILFNATVQTKGYVALGLSTDGNLQGADIIIGGVGPFGQPYFSDRYGINNFLSVTDPSQDWRLHAAWENDTHTFLSFSRAFDTCDEYDYTINDLDLTTVIWEYGETDFPGGFHVGVRGQLHAYLLDPNVVPRSLKESTFRLGPPSQEILDKESLKLWTVNAKLTVPAQHTTYYCTMVKGPNINKKHHIVGYNMRLETADTIKYTHHLIMYHCTPPEGSTADEAFSRFLNHPGNQCYFLSRSSPGEVPVEHCRRTIFSLAIGSKMAFLPSTSGLPIGEAGGPEYYMFQVHYDNPDEVSGAEVDVNVDVYYTDRLRANDAGIITIGHHTPGSPAILLPPNSIKHHFYAHCSPECTALMFPSEGVSVVNVLLHTHNSGQKIKVRHFREGKELPWISADTNYRNSIQMIRTLSGETRVLPNDQLTIECEVNNVWANGTSVVGGFSTRHEMCLIFVHYHNAASGYSLCRSEISDPGYWRRYLGVNNITWNSSEFEYVATSPPELSGMTISAISNTVNWTPELRDALQQDHRSSPQSNTCSSSPSASSVATGYPAGTIQVSLPNVPVEYAPPPRDCSRRQFWF